MNEDIKSASSYVVFQMKLRLFATSNGSAEHEVRNEQA